MSPSSEIQNQTESMLRYIRSTYNVPAKIGRKIRYHGDPEGPKDGTIVGASSARLIVDFWDEKECVLHPTLNVDYLPEGS